MLGKFVFVRLLVRGASRTVVSPAGGGHSDPQFYVTRSYLKKPSLEGQFLQWQMW
ncbi:MAG TPA: hypothetical protein VKY31_05570 [Terriglobia bacterium]|jgi:hypothetical protein|nr:hypothetical protein [Terriglobia bacterium]